MKRVLLCVILALSPFLVGWTLSWDTPTYTDGTPINDDSVVYDVWKNGEKIADGVPGNQVLFLAEKGTTYTFVARARLVRQGVASDDSTPFVWTSPKGTPAAPGNLRAAP